jgi:hypothetical protein
MGSTARRELLRQTRILESLAAEIKDLPRPSKQFLYGVLAYELREAATGTVAHDKAAYQDHE